MKKISLFLIFLAAMTSSKVLLAGPGTPSSPASAYTMAVSNAMGGSATLTVSHSQICQGESVTLMATGSGGSAYRFDWSVSSGTAPVTAITSNSTYITSVTPTVTTTYSVTVTAKYGTSAQDAPVVKSLAVVVNENPKADAGLGGTFCPGSQVVLGGAPTATSGTPAYSYSWTPANNLNSPSSANPYVFPQSTTTFDVVVTDSKGCTASSECVWVSCTTTGVSEEQSLSEMSVFPMPFQEAVTLKMDASDPVTRVEVRDMMGRMVFIREIPVERELKIPMDTQPVGMYILSVQSPQGIRIRKMLKE